MTHPDTLTIPRAVVEQALEALSVCAVMAAMTKQKAAVENQISIAEESLRAALQQAIQPAQGMPEALGLLQQMWDYCDDTTRSGRTFWATPGLMRAWANALSTVEAALQPQAAAEPVLWQYRWTNPAGDNHPASMLEWKDVLPAWNQTVQNKVTELVAYRYNGNPTYEVRGLYTAPPATQAENPLLKDYVEKAVAAERRKWQAALTAALLALKAIAALEVEPGEILTGRELTKAVAAAKTTIAQLEALGE